MWFSALGFLCSNVAKQQRRLTAHSGKYIQFLHVPEHYCLIYMNFPKCSEIELKCYSCNYHSQEQCHDCIFPALTRSLSSCQLPLVSLSRWQLSQRWRKPRCFDLACKTAWNPAVRFLELHLVISGFLFKMTRMQLLRRAGRWYRNKQQWKWWSVGGKCIANAITLVECFMNIFIIQDLNYIVKIASKI